MVPSQCPLASVDGCADVATAVIVSDMPDTRAIDISLFMASLVQKSRRSTIRIDSAMRAQPMMALVARPVQGTW